MLATNMTLKSRKRILVVLKIYFLKHFVKVIFAKSKRDKVKFLMEI